MAEVLFLDTNSTPMSNFIKRLLIPVFFIPFILIGIPLYVAGLDRSILVFVIPGLGLLIFQTIVAFIYSRQYLYKLELAQDELILGIVGYRSKNSTVTIKNNKTVKIEMTESFLSFNTHGYSTWLVSFIQGNKCVFKQYQVGKWDAATFKKVLPELKEKGFIVNASISLKPDRVL